MKLSTIPSFFRAYLPSRLLMVGLFASFSFVAGNAQAQCPNPGYDYTVGCNLGVNENVNLSGNESLYIPEGVTYTGRINLNGNNTSSIYNYGTWDAGNLNVSGAATVYNYANASFDNLNLNGRDARVFNSGSLTSQRLNLGGFVSNARNSTIFAPEVNINSGGQLDNLGNFTTNVINNNAILRNCGTLLQGLTAGRFTNNAGTVSNYGVIDIRGDFTNNSDFTGSETGGVGVVRVAGESRQNGGGSFAVIGRLDFCDATSSNGGRFDTNTGTLGSTTSPDPTLPANLTYCRYNANSPEVAGCNNSPLPVELTSFEVKLSKGSVLLTWSTASEKNNEKFVVERSANGEVFEALTEVAGHGTSASAHAYSATDQAPLAGTSYYRLRQIDFDGTTAYSPVATIQNAATAQANKLGVYPNPTADHITLDLPKNIGETYEVQITSVSGKLVRRMTLHGNAPQLDLHGLPAGTYLLQVRGANTQLVQRLIKQ